MSEGKRLLAVLALAFGGALALWFPAGSPGLAPIGHEVAAATRGAQFSTPHEVCANTDADPACETSFGTACSQQGGSCAWCFTAPGTHYRKCVPSEEGDCERVPGGAGAVDCGTRFTGTCITTLTGLICHGTPSGTCNSGGSLQHECNL